jgi:hypothetical protein
MVLLTKHRGGLKPAPPAALLVAGGKGQQAQQKPAAKGAKR